MLSPQSKGLFSRAIRQSGSALNYWGLMEGPSPSQRAKEFSQRFNCPLDTMQNMVSCLRILDASTLVAGHIDLMVKFKTEKLTRMTNCANSPTFLMFNPGASNSASFKVRPIDRDGERQRCLSH